MTRKLIRGANSRLSHVKSTTILAAYVTIFTYLTKSCAGNGIRPEVTLLDVVAQPLVPTDAASAECLRDSAVYITSLGNYTPWALQMYDASVKIPSGLITGNVKQLGNYDECLRVKNANGFVGQACTALVSFEIFRGANSSNETDLGDLLINVARASGMTDWIGGTTSKYEWTLCVPSSCTYAEIREMIDTSLDPLRVEGRVDLEVSMTENSCHTAETAIRKLDTADWIYVTLLILFAVIAISSTAFDLITRNKYEGNRKDVKQVVLTSFSFYTNGKTLLNTKRNGDSIGCLDGLRFISICWIIYGHTHYYTIVGVQLDVSNVHIMHENWSTLLVLNGNIVTDTFFLLSGLLLAYTKYSQKQRNRGSSLNLFELYLRRYVRLTPVYAMVIGFYSTIYNKFGSGPEWDVVITAAKESCQANWWANLLYVNNMVTVEDICITQSWYLAVDMQLLWLSPIFLYPMLKFSRGTIFWAVLGIGLTVAIVVPFSITYAMELTGTMLYYKDQTDVVNVFLEVYTKTYARAGSYLIGIGIGYFLAKSKSLSIQIPKAYAIIGWIVTAVLLGTTVFGPRGMYYSDHVYNRLEASFYAGFHRPAFALAISWIIFACVNGKAGPINGLLAWTGWLPLSRLTYSAYLSHFIVLLYNSGIARAPGNVTPYTVVHDFLGNLVLVLGLSTVISLVFEMPFMTLDRVLWKIKGRQADTRANLPDPAKLENTEEIYKSIKGSLSSVSQIYTDVAGIAKSVGGSYVTNFDPSNGYYVDQVDRSSKPENVYTYIVGSQIGTPRSERRYDVPTNRATNSAEGRFDSSDDIVNFTESIGTQQTTGVDNRAYQV
ncbi:nose resistant to fluoxetine protein 6 isoform X1 [Neodiprion lecontei]|uniref:Nose resistant to fluoxetine protein 6 isoform X1 n=2 Tax=Neodiprion lecontei TaxID=441921 RepID=A0A6J0C7H3_NEOLC|nr:nose resistant to fluoxetine protein 6 isoform X1 [Neodiprion lecontei]